MDDAEKYIHSGNEVPERFLIVSDEQTNGQGRNGNIWYSPPGGLWFTYAFRHNAVSQNLTLFLGCCLQRVLSEQFPVLQERLLIKWPNDLLLNDNKVSGILVRHLKGYLLIGIGINTNNASPSFDNAFQPASLKQFLGFDISNKALLDKIINSLERELTSFTSRGLDSVYDYLNAHLYGLGQLIYFNTGKEVICCKCSGIDLQGALLLESQDGKLNAYISGSVVSLVI
jgi:BirA family transcriptional regulator, biotin operon repressor / biotin---[acetyl-CoA-carboxylase] ligase